MWVELATTVINKGCLCCQKNDDNIFYYTLLQPISIPRCTLHLCWGRPLCSNQPHVPGKDKFIHYSWDNDKMFVVFFVDLVDDTINNLGNFRIWVWDFDQSGHYGHSFNIDTN